MASEDASELRKRNGVATLKQPDLAHAAGQHTGAGAGAAATGQG